MRIFVVLDEHYDQEMPVRGVFTTWEAARAACTTEHHCLYVGELNKDYRAGEKDDEGYFIPGMPTYGALERNVKEGFSDAS